MQGTPSKAGPTKQFWEERFERNETPWDRGVASPALLRWLDAGALAPCRILVPGCGAGHEVVELARRGFDVTGLDYAPAALVKLRARLAAGKLHAETVEADALAWTAPAAFDAVYEQTALCALHPDHWCDYASRVSDWVKPGGQLFLLIAQVARPRAAQGFIDGPPYHCDVHAVRALFAEPAWSWPKPPYERIEHPGIPGFHELALVLQRNSLALRRNSLALQRNSSALRPN
jgi:methyl halide transferase